MALYDDLNIQFYNTATRQKEAFEPREEGRVGMYVCGITPYNYAHIGNARPAIVFDTLFRFLQAVGYDVTYVRNFTDVDDKIINAANAQGVECSEITDKFIDIYLDDMAFLNVLEPSVQPKVTETIPEIISLIEKNIANGFAYVTDSGDVMYDITKFENYGKLAGKKLDELTAGARVDVDETKKNAGDFALWKAAKSGEPSWDSPWGKGRPGWHIECSAMSEKFLGPQFDIHGGGEDLQFPHHENEIAQSHGANCSCNAEYKYVKYWMHNAFINVDGEKMSKSLGNFKTVHGLLEHFDGEVLRMWMLSTHYRKPLDLTEEGLQNAQNALTGLYTAMNTVADDADVAIDSAVLDAFYAALGDDLNTPAAMALLFEEAKKINKGDASAAGTLQAMADVIGLLQHDAADFLKGGASDDESAEIDALVQARTDAKAAKDFAKADAIRDDLKARGIIVEDFPTGSAWRRG